MHNSPFSSDEVESDLLQLRLHQQVGGLADQALNSVTFFAMDDQSKIRACSWGMAIASLPNPARAELIAIMEMLASQDPLFDDLAIGYIRAMCRSVRRHLDYKETAREYGRRVGKGTLEVIEYCDERKNRN
jgi:hypothetical protein